MKLLVAALMRWLETILGLGLIAIIAINFANVIGRYVFNKSFLGSEEIQLFGMIWIAFVGAAVVTWRNMHLRMDALSKMLPAAVQPLLKITELCVCLAVVGFVIQQSWDYVDRMRLLGNHSDVAQIPMWIPHAAVLTGFTLIALMLIAAVLTGGDSRLSAEGESEGKPK